MSNKSNLAVITAASIGVVLTQSSSLLAEKQDSSAPEKVTKIAAPIDLDEEVLYWALPDEALEKAAGSGGKVAMGTECLDNPLRKGCSVRALPKTNAQGPSNGTKPTRTGPTVTPKPVGR